MQTNKLDINKELERLIEKYNIDRHYPAYRESRKACNYIRKWIEELSNSKQTYLFIGMDEHALRLLDAWKGLGGGI